MEKFGKTSKGIMGKTRDFSLSNDALMAREENIIKQYSAQPKRTHCQCCASPILPSSDHIVRKGICYFFCETCSHVNGEFENTPEFSSALYHSTQYASTYHSDSKEAYESRTNNIYVPKAEFLLQGLEEQGEDPKSIKIADIGSGSGYFLAALQKKGIQNT